MRYDHKRTPFPTGTTSADCCRLTEPYRFIELLFVTGVTSPLGSYEAIHVGSPPTTRTTSEQALYRLLRLLLQKSERAHAVAPPFQIEPASLGFNLVLGANLETAASILFQYSKKRDTPSGVSLFLVIQIPTESELLADRFCRT